MSTHSISRLAAILAVAALPACAADSATPEAARPAQMAMGGPGHDGGPGMHRHHGRHHGRHGAMMAPQHIEGRLAFLKTELKITDTQLPQWNAFAEAMRAQAKVRAERHDAHKAKREARGHGEHERESKPLPERFSAMEKMMQERLQHVQRYRAAVEPLYGVLTPEQRKTADKLLGRG